MLTTHADSAGHENLLPEIKRHAQASLECFHRNRRFLRLIDTRQKWMLVHLISLTCSQAGRGPAKGTAANWICERASSLGVASRNTSLAFFSQLAAYGYIHRQDDCDDRRVKLMSLSQTAEAALLDWTRGLVETATGKSTAALDDPAIHRAHLGIIDRLFKDPKWLKAPLDIRLTQDTRGGWLFMSEILRHIPDNAADRNWVPAPGLTVPAMAKTFGLSRSTLYRLVRQATEAGIMAWDERQSGMLNVNLYHLKQYSRWVGRTLQAAGAASEGTIGADVAARVAHAARHPIELEHRPRIGTRQGFSLGL